MSPSAMTQNVLSLIVVFAARHLATAERCCISEFEQLPEENSDRYREFVMVNFSEIKQQKCKKQKCNLCKKRCFYKIIFMT